MYRSTSFMRGAVANLAFALAIGAAFPSSAQAETDGTPLELPPGQLAFFQTANQLARGAGELWIGFHQTDPNGPASSTGNQFYHGGGAYGVTDRLQLGFAVQHFEDPPGLPIRGKKPPTRIQTIGGTAKFNLYDGARARITAVGGVDYFVFASDLFKSRGGLNANHIVPSLQLPVSIKATDQLQFHLTPSVSRFPDRINGRRFYGTNANIGTGVSWQPNRRWLAFGTAIFPMGPGGNNISSTRTITRKMAFTLGGRFNVSPKAAIELYATNAYGATPGTNSLLFFPNGKQMLYGARLIYTPGHGSNYRPSYRDISTPLTPRQIALQMDGFTLSSADTVSAGDFLRGQFGGTFGSYGSIMQFSPDHDGQLELAIESYARDGSVAPPTITTYAPRYMLGVKLRFLDQNNGSPFSLSIHTTMGRDLTPLKPGTFYADVPVSYKANAKLALTFSPKIAAFGNTVTYGAGVGANYQLTPRIQLIGETTGVAHGKPAVWAAGLRYMAAKRPMVFDVHATNAIGQHGLGTLVAQSSIKLAATFSMRMNLGNLYARLTGR